MPSRSGSTRMPCGQPGRSRLPLRCDGYFLKGESRTINEDHFQAAIWPPEAGSQIAFLVVADGMEGHPAGEFACRLTMSHILRPASEKTFNIADDALTGIPRGKAHPDPASPYGVHGRPLFL